MADEKAISRAEQAAADAAFAAGHLVALDRAADRELAVRSHRVAFVFVPVVVLLTFITDLKDSALAWSLGTAGIFLMTGYARLRLAGSFDRAYDASPGRWRSRFALVAAMPAAICGLWLPTIIVTHGVSWTFLVCMLASAGIAAGAVSSLSPRIRILRAFVSLILLPSAATLALVGHGREAGLAVLLMIYWVQMMILANYFHAELWSSLRKGAELERRAAELAAANQQALAASEAKSSFLANMSHEIRTPMNGILGLTGVVLESELTDDQRELLTDVRTSGEALLRIVNEILDFSKIEAGRLELDSAPFAVADLVERVLKPQRVAAERRGNSLTARIAGDVPPWLLGDEHRLWQVLTNLVGNAAKFTENGRIEVAVALAGSRFDVPLVSLSVTDSGIGIAPEVQPTLFEAFHQADGSTTRRYGGTGLGLAISARLAGLMGGSIKLTSAPGQGSTFNVVVPLPTAQAPVKAEIAANAAGRAAVGAGLRVLLAEDNPVNAKLATRLLSRLGAEAVWVDNGELAVEAWRAGDFDLVLMDVQMPGMDGFQATNAIRRHEADSGRGHVPIVALTAHALDGYREKCVEEGMDDYLTKPLRSSELEDAVARWRPLAV